MGINFLVEYDPASQWYTASLTMAAGWLRSGGRVTYGTSAQPPHNIRTQLNRLGLNTEELEMSEKLDISDWYTATLGQKSKEKTAWSSLKVADLSIEWSRNVMHQPPASDLLRMLDDLSCLDRFNDERSWVEFVRTRLIPTASLRNQIAVRGIIGAVHSNWAYKNLEASHDGIIDFKLDEVDGRTANFIRIRSLRNARFDSEWHELKIGENFEVNLDR